MSTKRISQVPPGSKDLVGEAVRRRRDVQARWLTLAEARGYGEVMPPTFEYEEVFTLGVGSDIAQRLVRFVDRDGRVVALRADFTSALARLAATRLSDGNESLRLCYAGKVYRQEAETGGRPREVFQCGAELIGEAEVESDIEILRFAIDFLRTIGLDEFQLNVGNPGFLKPVLSSLSDRDAAGVRTAIDRRDRAALMGFAERLGTRSDGRTILRALPDLVGRSPVLDRAAAAASDPGSEAAVQRLRAIDAALSDDERRHLVYDLGEVRGLGYYTGMQFEIFVAGVGRAVGRGGRYDTLLARYGTDRPAVGVGFELDTLAELRGRP